jgi:hypothetical protein
MAIAAAPYLHPKLSPIDVEPNERKTPGVPDARDVGIRVEFVRPRPRNDDGELIE